MHASRSNSIAGINNLLMTDECVMEHKRSYEIENENNVFELRLPTPRGGTSFLWRHLYIFHRNNFECSFAQTRHIYWPLVLSLTKVLRCSMPPPK